MIFATRASSCTRGGAMLRSAPETPVAPLSLPTRRAPPRRVGAPCMITSRGWRRQGTKGRWRTDCATRPSAMSASTAFAAAAACSRRPGWWKASP
eukprot:6211087-Pleurochrysis_carterae.AAC.3